MFTRRFYNIKVTKIYLEILKLNEEAALYITLFNIVSVELKINKLFMSCYFIKSSFYDFRKRIKAPFPLDETLS